MKYIYRLLALVCLLAILTGCNTPAPAGNMPTNISGNNTSTVTTTTLTPAPTVKPTEYKATLETQSVFRLVKKYDTIGSELFNWSYDNVFSNKDFVVIKNRNESAVMDKNGNLLLPFRDGTYWQYKNYITFSSSETDNDQIYNLDFKLLTTIKDSEYKIFQDCIVCSYSGGQKVIDTNGNAITVTLDNGEVIINISACSKRIFIENKGNHFIKDFDGKQLGEIPGIYEYVYFTSNFIVGKAPEYNNASFIVYDNQLKKLYDAPIFNWGTMLETQDYVFVYQNPANGDAACIDKNGKDVFKEMGIDYIYYADEHYMAVDSNNKAFLMDTKLNKIDYVPDGYELIEHNFSMNDKHGVILKNKATGIRYGAIIDNHKNILAMDKYWIEDHDRYSETTALSYNDDYMTGYGYEDPRSPIGDDETFVCEIRDKSNKTLLYGYNEKIMYLGNKFIQMNIGTDASTIYQMQPEQIKPIWLGTASVSSGALNIRLTPDTKGTKIYEVKNGTKLMVTRELSGGWLEIITPSGVIAYAKADFIKK